MMADERRPADRERPADRDGGLAKAYRPAEFEGPIYERWLAADVFAPDGAGSRADAARPPFVIIQPPPNVTGSLHLGHAQRSAVEDLMIRHARMQGGRPSSCRASTTPASPPSSSSTGSSPPRARRARAWAASATSSGCGASSTRRGT